MASATVDQVQTHKCVKCDQPVAMIGTEWSGGRFGTRCYAGGYGGAHVVLEGRTAEYTRWEGGRLMSVRYCGYCWARFEVKGTGGSYFCSPGCSRRNSAWNSWVRDTNSAAIHGDVNKPAKVGAKLPPAGKTLEQVSVRAGTPRGDNCQGATRDDPSPQVTST